MPAVAGYIGLCSLLISLMFDSPRNFICTMCVVGFASGVLGTLLHRLAIVTNQSGGQVQVEMIRPVVQ